MISELFLVLIGIELLIIAKDLLAIRTSEHRIWSEKMASALLISIRTVPKHVFVLEGEDAGLIRQFIMQRVQNCGTMFIRCGARNFT